MAAGRYFIFVGRIPDIAWQALYGNGRESAIAAARQLLLDTSVSQRRIGSHACNR
jgi:hypothetical protein